MNYNRILIIGFRCTGKTTISRELSKYLNFECLDIDNLIEEEQEKSIVEITNNGEDWSIFRELETFKIKELLNFDNVVISAGGGLGVNNIKYNSELTYGDIQKEIVKRSVDTLKILLVADDNVIKERLLQGRFFRPDLGNKTFNEEEYIESNLKIMKERENNYREMADIVFDSSSSDILQNVNNLLEIIIKLQKA